MKTYFITGATGAIGAALIPLLLEDSEVRVFLLIRAKDQANLHSRMAELLKFWDYPLDNHEIISRITPLMGDATLPGFGLPDEAYGDLCREVTHIIHSAGNVRMNLPIEEARKSSIDSARHIIDLAHRCKEAGHLQKVEFVSTVGVGGRMPGLIPETWITQKREFHNTYEQAKAEAEVIVKEEIEKGLPITVHRPSMVVGDSKTGKIIHFQIFYHICEFLSGRRTFGFIPKIKDTRLDIIPADYVAAAIRWSSTTPETSGSILHLCSGPDKAIPIQELGDKVRRLYGTMGIALPITWMIPMMAFTSIIPLISFFLSPKSRRALKALPVFLDYLSEIQAFQSGRSTVLLEKQGITPPGNDFLTHILGRYLNKKEGDA